MLGTATFGGGERVSQEVGRYRREGSDGADRYSAVTEVVWNWGGVVSGVRNSDSGVRAAGLEGASGPTPFSTSFHVTGAAMEKLGRARGEYPDSRRAATVSRPMRRRGARPFARDGLGFRRPRQRGRGRQPCEGQP
jgi:hypothetical protein